MDEERLFEVEGRDGGTRGGERDQANKATGSGGEGNRELEAAEEEAAPGRRKHKIRRMGGLLWCDECGAYATQRAGARIRGACDGAVNTRHRLTRLERLRKGRRPIKNQALEGPGLGIGMQEEGSHHHHQGESGNG